MTDVKHLTVGRLRTLLADRPDDELVIVHAGWDFPILDDEYDYPRPDTTDEGGVADRPCFCMYLDYQDGASMVSKTWLDSVRGESETS